MIIQLFLEFDCLIIGIGKWWIKSIFEIMIKEGICKLMRL